MTKSRVEILLVVATALTAACSSTLAPATHDSGTPAPSDSGADVRMTLDSGTDAKSDGATPTDACSAGVKPGEVPTGHRAVATACAPTPVDLFGNRQIGQISCTTNADCRSDGGTGLAGVGTCLSGHCSYDFCLTDADCGADEACVCGSSNEYPNVCVPTGCHVDSDCGDGGYCSLSRTGLGSCGIVGFHCHTPNDTCVNPDDCCGGTPLCVYAPTSGTFVCAAPVCAG